MDDLRFKDNVRFLDFRKVFEESRPFPELLFPTAFVDVKTLPDDDGRYGLLFRKIGDLFATGFVLDESALARKLVDSLLVCCVGDEPERMSDGAIFVVDSSFSRHARRRRPLKAGTGHKFRIIKIVITDSGLCLHV